jgi:uncharacterized protein (DUF1778 family)
MAGKWLRRRDMPAKTPPNKNAKVDRIELRASPRQTSVIRQAAQASGKTISSFMLDAAYLEAERALADRRLFRLDEAKWSRFIKALDRPTAAKSHLRKLMQTPSALE